MALSDIANTKIAWRKGEIKQLLNGFGRDFIANTINEIVCKEMNISIDDARKMKTIKPSIVKIILLEFE